MTDFNKILEDLIKDIGGDAIAWHRKNFELRTEISEAVWISTAHDKIETYIKYYNLCLCKPLKWKFKGFFKGTPLKNIQLAKT